ncbi:GNAT family N-acetyltransferase [Streptomyces sp. NA02950]|uniref:GNAT family N-acetyltransferase n=1 Tax=Streptomyces sp. NA02950 TaxID=2742137 RepID=UPI0015900C18|nr:GNAT family N-acetyltransferase [Streptomyces sp. NA02950]QKV94970.1 GNAT family N-acetyltransferase [Streptomyces sp. NA02950]
MTTALRVLDPAVWDDWYGKLVLAFGGVPEAPEESGLWRELTECERSIGVWDGEEIVGTAGLFSFRMTVPGGASVAAPGVTMVSVQATHRRRGVLRSMMRRQLDDIRAAGEPLAVLTASEPDIYGRFGYGIATQSAYAEIDTGRVRLSVPAGTDQVTLREVAPADGVERCEAVYARLVPTRPGMLERLPGWERLPVLDPPGERDGASPLRCVLAESGGEVTGYARFAIKPDWDLAGPKGAIVLRDLEALDPASHAALWRFLFEIDLTSAIRTGGRPVDDPWQHLVSDIRRCQVRLRDSLHVRLVEVGAALEARAYTAPLDVVLEVTDPFCPWNEGRWRLTGDAKGASCARTSDAPDLRLGVRELGAAYLGGVSLDALAGAGRVREVSEGALGAASAAFLGTRAPWLPHGF